MQKTINKRMGHKKACPILFTLLKLSQRWPIILSIVFYADIGVCDLADDYNRQGIERIKNARYREAIVYFETARNANPENNIIKRNLSVAYHHLALEFASDSEWTIAIQNEKLALENDPQNPTIKEQLAVFYNNLALKEAQDRRYESAIENLKEALKYAWQDAIRTNLYNMLLTYADLYKNRDDSKALNLAKEAISIMPHNVAAYIFIGNIHYQQDNFKDALEHWDKAIALNPENAQLRAQIEKLKRESEVESKFNTRKRQHFRIRFERETDSDYIWAISDILEDMRRDLRNEFNLYSDEIIPVIVYPAEQFEEAVNVSHWTQGLYDGKIRFKTQDISGGDKILKKILYHEYAHAILYLVYGNNIPTWLHEGFAQVCEPEVALNDVDKNFLRSYLNKIKPFSIEDLDSMFTERKDFNILQAAYLESRLFVQYLIKEYRKDNLKRLFEQLKEAMPWQEALRIVSSRDINRLNEDFNRYLDGILE